MFPQAHSRLIPEWADDTKNKFIYFFNNDWWLSKTLGIQCGRQLCSVTWKPDIANAVRCSSFSSVISDVQVEKYMQNVHTCDDTKIWNSGPQYSPWQIFNLCHWNKGTCVEHFENTYKVRNWHGTPRKEAECIFRIYLRQMRGLTSLTDM